MTIPTLLPLRAVLFLLFVANCLASIPAQAADDTLSLRLRSQSPTAPNSGRYHRTETATNWAASETALIVCDMWDSHHCFRAVEREREMAPVLDRVIAEARRCGVTIIHAPSDCMDAYVDHPARLRTLRIPAASQYPPDIANWCDQIPAEEQAIYPIDQSDGGEDDTPAEHTAWENTLKAEGRNPSRPWRRQIDLIRIDENNDYISDSGTEIWSILQSSGIKNVMLAGVHTNMCVLGRPFGLRRLSMAGKNVVLIRDLTDTMYNPAAWPFVSHHSGTDLIVSHIERHVAPTVTSDQLIGGKPFRYGDDDRPHVAMIINEPEYETERTLPLFATELLNRDHRVSYVYGDESDPNRFPGIALVSEADVLLLSVRRRTPPTEELRVIREFAESAKPILGIRTANHAFSLRGQPAPDGCDQWPSFDADIFGGSYTNHYGATLSAIIELNPLERKHPVLANIEKQPFIAGGSLYKVLPLAEKTNVLMIGTVDGQQPEPVAWTFSRKDGGKSFYTSLGAPADFEHPTFQSLLLNAIQWATTN